MKMTIGCTDSQEGLERVVRDGGLYGRIQYQIECQMGDWTEALTMVVVMPCWNAFEGEKKSEVSWLKWEDQLECLNRFSFASSRCFLLDGLKNDMGS